MMKTILLGLAGLLFGLTAAAQKLTPVLAKTQLEAYDYQEITVNVKKPAAAVNPFKDVKLTATFTAENGQPVTAEGFCDSPDGTVYKIRFMPSTPGTWTYALKLAQNGKSQQASGKFTVQKSSRKGPLRLDKENPWHFVFENTGEHYFWNSTTTYWLMGWKDEKIINESIDRLARLGINRIRVAINGRAHGGDRWSEPNVVESPNFTFLLNPWVAQRPNDLDNPGFDVTRMNVAHWQKLDRLVARARDRGLIVSLIFYVDGLDHATDPFKKERMGDENEQLYYRYAAARYSGFENIMWDIANEYHLFRTPDWAEKMGTLLRASDPVRHLISVHGNADFPFRKSPWVDVVMFQSWDECGGYQFMTECRRKQAETGRILPQINEEYGYEEHYPQWGCGTKFPDGRSADNRRRLAWEICMTGSYQTTGERADFGTGKGEDSGGGWINGRGNDKMTMLPYYNHLKTIFQQTHFWKLSPNNSLVDYGNLCLADVGNQYLVYSRLHHCQVALPKGQTFSVAMWNPRTGEKTDLPDFDTEKNTTWRYQKSLVDDWVFILKRK
ncbi:DUF5060 domain-containing protein [Tellurirhabdus rosea]|uniref:DUF5060 domain-containing protein n=1 Tax=Tellurirhabdus rosea TaxID=2674997 RepID=UPI00225A308C|nr:DUF5060 domain-containing protein [Tellurirhabdus rosea]